jgi:hypothetical protein
MGYDMKMQITLIGHKTTTYGTRKRAKKKKKKKKGEK